MIIMIRQGRVWPVLSEPEDGFDAGISSISLVFRGGGGVVGYKWFCY